MSDTFLIVWGLVFTIINVALMLRSATDFELFVRGVGVMAAIWCVIAGVAGLV